MIDFACFCFLIYNVLSISEFIQSENIKDANLMKHIYFKSLSLQNFLKFFNVNAVFWDLLKIYILFSSFLKNDQRSNDYNNFVIRANRTNCNNVAAKLSHIQLVNSFLILIPGKLTFALLSTQIGRFARDGARREEPIETRGLRVDGIYLHGE